MHAWTWILIIFGSYFGGAWLVYVADGWFNYSKDDPKELAAQSFLWPLLFLFLPVFIAEAIHNSLKTARIKRLERKEKQERIRVAAEKEIETIEADLAAEFEQRTLHKTL